MRQYLATLHKRPDHHKKRFALLVSGTVTIIIFAIWALISFNNAKIAENVPAHPELSPVASLKADASTGLQEIGQNLNELKNGTFLNGQ